ncbi:glycoside hydrolase family 31 protein [Wallemia mellicola]|nr:glycoside hydrolase family 31 protein [Wallemia mellicola]
MRVTFLGILIALFLGIAECVKQNDFKKCQQSSFCRRLRSLSDRKTNSSVWESPYAITRGLEQLGDEAASYTWKLNNRLAPEGIAFDLAVDVLKDGLIRLRVDESGGLYQRYNQTASYILVDQPELMQASSVKITSYDDVDNLAFQTSTNQPMELKVYHNPLNVQLKNAQSGEILVDINGESLLHMEHFRHKDAEDTDNNSAFTWHSEQPFEDPNTDGLWEESFNNKPDSKPKGPEAFSIDINFPSHAHVYGIPEHASPLALPPTDGSSPRRVPYVDDPKPYTEPYRLYNLDVFEYEANSPMALYGSVPLMHAHSPRSSLAVFLLSAAEMWIDVKHPTKESTSTQWISESGIIDLFLIPGPTIEDVFSQYASLTGVSQMPQEFSLGHHQCRWNYFTSKDMLGVVSGYDSIDAPVDVIWLDIEYSDGHKYFMWDKKKFPDPVDMVNKIASKGRKTVNIVDPHLSRDDEFYVFNEASDKEVLVKKPDGQSEYEGWCWAGSSSWVDMFNPASWDWWISLFKFDKWKVSCLGTKEPILCNLKKDSTPDLFTWVDMNEPAVFNGPEITMPKDTVFYGGVEHRDLHNINGILFANLTSQALEQRQEKNSRSFVLSRSFYAGSQRFGAVWTGDNLGTWDHLRSATPMNLANNIGGIVFTGADVGGFFGNPQPEYLVRWYQTGAFHPFFRAHAHIDTKRREPYVLDEPYQSIVREVLRLRYSLLPVWYTSFRENTQTGLPILRPQFVVHPSDAGGFDIDDQFYISDSGLLVKPVVHEGAQSVDVYFAGEEPYYDYFTHEISLGSKHKGRRKSFFADLETLPLFIRGGSIIPSRQRARRSASVMSKDPLTLTIALDKNGNANGRLYLDDGHTFDYQDGAFIDRQFTFKSDRRGWTLTSSEIVPGDSYEDGNEVFIERIEVLGLKAPPKEIKVDGRPLEFSWEDGTAASSNKEDTASLLNIKKPLTKIAHDFKIIA